MTPFSHLSREERALFNPAYLALVSCRAVQGHQKTSGPCPLPIAVTAAVMALQPAIRALLPGSTRGSLTNWIEQQPTVRIAMKANATGLSSIVRPGLLFAVQTGLLAIDESGRLSVNRRAIPAAIAASDAPVATVQRAANLLGRWLPSGGGTATVLALLGVRP